VANQQSLIALAPVVLVVAVVVITRLGHADLEELGMAEECRRRGEASARMSPDSHALDIDERISFRELPHSGDLLRKRVVAHVTVVRFVERLRAAGRSHPDYCHQ